MCICCQTKALPEPWGELRLRSAWENCYVSDSFWVHASICVHLKALHKTSSGHWNLDIRLEAQRRTERALSVCFSRASYTACQGATLVAALASEPLSAALSAALSGNTGSEASRLWQPER